MFSQMITPMSTIAPIAIAMPDSATMLAATPNVFIAMKHIRTASGSRALMSSELRRCITITSITDDTGTSSSDFVTKDNLLTYTGKVPADFVDANYDVLVEIRDSTGTVVRTHNITGSSSISNNTWTWTDPGTGLADGNYTIRATIVDAGTSTPTSSFGTAGEAIQPMVIDATLPTMTISSSASAINPK